MPGDPGAYEKLVFVDQVEASQQVPAVFKRRAWSLKLLVNPDEAPEPEVDQRLIRLVARGFEWTMMLTSGRAKSIADIAATESVTGSYVTRVIQVGFLAPGIIEQIAQGKQPVELTPIKLLGLGALPLDWGEQNLALGSESKA